MDSLLTLMNDYIVGVVMLICLGIGYVMKNNLTFIDNHYITPILMVLGVILNWWNSGFEFTPFILLGGICSGLAASGAYEVKKQLTEVKQLKANSADHDNPDDVQADITEGE